MNVALLFLGSAFVGGVVALLAVMAYWAHEHRRWLTQWHPTREECVRGIFKAVERTKKFYPDAGPETVAAIARQAWK